MITAGPMRREMLAKSYWRARTIWLIKLYISAGAKNLLVEDIY